MTLRVAMATALALLAGAAVLGADRARAVSPAPGGCAMSHCDVRMSDEALFPAPRSLQRQWFDAQAASAEQGLGCVANGKIALCTFGDREGDYDRPYLKAYAPNGEVLWDSGTTLNSWAWTSVPILDRRGGAITADDANLVRYAPGGEVRWATPTPGGRPISPTRTADGTIVLATAFGPVSAFDPRSGEHLATLDLTATLDGLPGRFDTTNTPGARGNRIYVSTDFKVAGGLPDPNHHARLYAIDVDPDAPADRRLEVAWYFDFGARSGASPLITDDGLIIFDGDRARADGPVSPRFFALRDRGDSPELVWQYELEGPGVASAAQDPRGGVWVFAFAKRTLRRISEADGRELQAIDLDAVTDEPGVHAPLSAMTVAEGPQGHPVLLVTARSIDDAFLVAVDLVTERALWKHPLPQPVAANTPMGQFPIVRDRRGARLTVFSMRSGIAAVGERALKRRVKLSYAPAAGVLRGRVLSRRPACRRATVTVLHKRRGAQHRFARTTTAANGRWRLSRAAKPGRYRAVVKPKPRGDGVCAGAESRSVRVR